MGLALFFLKNGTVTVSGDAMGDTSVVVIVSIEVISHLNEWCDKASDRSDLTEVLSECSVILSFLASFFSTFTPSQHHESPKPSRA